MAFSGVDFYRIDDLLSDEERMVRDTVRRFVDELLVTILPAYCVVKRGLAFAREVDRDLVAGGAGLDGVAEEVPRDLPHLRGIGEGVEAGRSRASLNAR